MSDENESKVALDPQVNESVANVAIAPPPPSNAKHHRRMQHQKNSSSSIVKKILDGIMDFLETIVVALSIFVIFYLFLVQPHEVKGNSMEPSFHNNEYILTDKLSFRFRKPDRGEIVIFKAPRNPELDYIKRVIALPGDRIRITGGHVYINDEILNESYLRSPTTLFPGNFLKDNQEESIPEDTYFVMGDNRNQSSDSREFGPIPRQSIVGRAFFRYWPPPSFGLIPTISY